MSPSCWKLHISESGVTTCKYHIGKYNKQVSVAGLLVIRLLTGTAHGKETAEYTCGLVWHFRHRCLASTKITPLV